MTQDATQSRKGGQDSGGIKIHFMTGFQLSKRPAISYGSRLTKTMPKPSKTSIRVAFIYLLVIHRISM